MDLTANQLTLSSTIAQCLNNDGVTPQDVRNLLAVANSPGLLSSVKLLWTSDENFIHIRYDVVSYTITTSYTALSSDLTAAVTNGVFNSLLAVNAHKNNAITLFNVTSFAVTTANTMDTESRDVLKKSSSVNMTVTIIAVFGGVLLLIAIAITLFWRYAGRKRFNYHNRNEVDFTLLSNAEL